MEHEYETFLNGGLPTDRFHAAASPASTSYDDRNESSDYEMRLRLSKSSSSRVRSSSLKRNKKSRRQRRPVRSRSAGSSGSLSPSLRQMSEESQRLLRCDPQSQEYPPPPPSSWQNSNNRHPKVQSQQRLDTIPFERLSQRRDSMTISDHDDPELL